MGGGEILSKKEGTVRCLELVQLEFSISETVILLLLYLSYKNQLVGLVKIPET